MTCLFTALVAVAVFRCDTEDPLPKSTCSVAFFSGPSFSLCSNFSVILSKSDGILLVVAVLMVHWMAFHVSGRCQMFLSFPRAPFTVYNDSSLHVLCVTAFIYSLPWIVRWLSSEILTKVGKWEAHISLIKIPGEGVTLLRILSPSFICHHELKGGCPRGGRSSNFRIVGMDCLLWVRHCCFGMKMEVKRGGERVHCSLPRRLNINTIWGKDRRKTWKCHLPSTFTGYKN